MKYQNTPAHPGVTAIAAVLALTTTPAVAQMIVPDPLGAQASPAADPPAPAPASAAPAPSAPDQPALVQPETAPKLPDLAVTNAKGPGQAGSARPQKAVPATTKAIPATSPAPKRWTVTPAPSTVSPVASDAPVAPHSDLLEPLPVAESAKPAADLPAPASQNGIWLPLAGGLLLAGGGAAFAVRRRRKPRAAAQVRSVAMAPLSAPQPAPVRAPVAASAGPAPRKTAGHRAALEALVAQPPSPENPFHTRKLRLRRAHYLLRTGQVAAALPEAPAAPVAAARSQTDRWSEMRIAGQSPVRLSWRPVQG